MRQLRGLISHFHCGTAGTTVTRSGVGRLRGVRVVSTPRERGLGAFGTSFAPLSLNMGSILSIGSLMVKCSGPLSAMGFLVGQNSGINVVNNGKLKGSAFVGALINRYRGLNNRCGFNPHIDMNCFSRRVTRCSSGSAILSSFLGTCPSLAPFRTEYTLNTFLFSNRSIFGAIGVLSNKRHMELTLYGVFGGHPGFLVLSRPAGRVSVTSGRTLRRVLMEFRKAILFISRSHCFVDGVSGSLVRFSGSGIAFFPCNCSRCLSTPGAMGACRGASTPGRGGDCAAPLGRGTGGRGTVGGYRRGVATLRTRVSMVRGRLSGSRIVASCVGLARLGRGRTLLRRRLLGAVRR